MKLPELMRQVGASLRDYVTRELGPVRERLAALDAAIKAIPAGKDGRDGKDGAPGPQGEHGTAGRDGAPGERGPRGEPGAQGKDGARGEKGDPGRDGKDGAPGKDGRDGRDGKDGAPGKDALELDVLPAIDEQRCYPRGTFARHCGGLWRAAANTQGMRGWECIVVGLSDVHIDQEDDRTILLGLTLSTGEHVIKRFTMPIVLDCGVYVPEREYAKGDGVTWAGSWWIAQVDQPTDKPGISEQWRLAVKRGRDGKDAK